jgi:hypothetical protein
MEITKLSVGFIGEGTPLWQTKVLFSKRFYIVVLIFTIAVNHFS